MNESAPATPVATIYWGSTPDKNDVPSVVEFATEAEMSAYFEGLAAADGWMEVEFVDGPNYRANRDGEVVQTRAKRGEIMPGERFAMWGDPPEPGTTPDLYRFDTEAEAEAFTQGAHDMVGWLKYHLVPDDSFRPYRDPEEALEALAPEAAEALKNHIELNDDSSVGYGDVVFVREDGAVVGVDWEPGSPIENQPLTREQWMEAFANEFEQGYGVSLVDLKINEAQVDELFASDMARMPEQAAENIAQARGLAARKPSVPPTP